VPSLKVRIVIHRTRTGGDGLEYILQSSDLKFRPQLVAFPTDQVYIPTPDYIYCTFKTGASIIRLSSRMTERPWVGALLALSGAGIMFLVGVTTVSSVPAAPRVIDVLVYTIELTAGIVVATCAILSLMFPRERKALGYVIASFSLLSLFGLAGTLCFGSLLGIFGSASLLVWSPVAPRICPNCGATMPRDSRTCPACETIEPYPSVDRPAESFAIALTALFFVHIATALGAIGPYPFHKFTPLELLPGVAAEAALLIGAVMVYWKPKQHRRWGAILIVTSFLALGGPYFGFILGPVLAFIAGWAAIRWKVG
jgi:hypothetical protein